MKELEGALGQLNAVVASRDVLRVGYKGQKGGDSMLNVDATAARDISLGKRAGSLAKQGETRLAAGQKMGSAKATRKQRMSKDNPESSTNIGSDTPVPKRTGRGPGQIQKTPAVKYRDPASDRTWSGRERRPNWLNWDAGLYLVSNLQVANGSKPDRSLKRGLRGHSRFIPGVGTAVPHDST